MRIIIEWYNNFMARSEEGLQPSVQIREARFEDVPQIEVLLRSSWEMHLAAEPELFNARRLRASNIQEYYREAIESKRSVVLVAEQNGQIAGFVKADEETIAPWYQENRVLNFDDLVVNENFRRQGIGRALILQVEQEARNRGIIRTFAAKIYTFNLPIQKLLESMGYYSPYRSFTRVLD